MNRRLIITDVTDMGHDWACVAGIDSATRQMVRLDPPHPQLALLDQVGGLTPGSVVDVEWAAEPMPRAPHVEDGRWVPQTLVKRGQLDEQQFVRFLGADAFDGVIRAFGEPSQWGWSAPENCTTHNDSRTGSIRIV